MRGRGSRRHPGRSPGVSDLEVRDGKIVVVRLFASEAEALKAVVLEE
jgi:hypothetical protein